MKKINTILLIIIILVTIILIISRLTQNGKENFCIDKMIDNGLATNNSKTVLLIHGYPEPIYEDSYLYRFFKDRDYNIIAPYLFAPEFKLTKEETKKYIQGKLNKKAPDVIVGVSMGGLIAPQIALDYPTSKLVMIATGPYVKTNVEILNDVVLNGEPKLLSTVFRIGKSIPTWLYSIFYKTFNHPKVTDSERILVEKHIRENWSCVTSIPVEEDVEVASFLASTDNTELLKKLENKTIIFAGDGDIMMPSLLSTKLNDFIKNSKLIISKDRLHYSVFNEKNYEDLDDFLSN